MRICKIWWWPNVKFTKQISLLFMLSSSLHLASLVESFSRKSKRDECVHTTYTRVDCAVPYSQEVFETTNQRMCASVRLPTRTLSHTTPSTVALQVDKWNKKGAFRAIKRRKIILLWFSSAMQTPEHNIVCTCATAIASTIVQ